MNSDVIDGKKTAAFLVLIFLVSLFLRCFHYDKVFSYKDSIKLMTT